MLEDASVKNGMLRQDLQHERMVPPRRVIKARLVIVALSAFASGPQLKNLKRRKHMKRTLKRSLATVLSVLMVVTSMTAVLALFAGAYNTGDAVVTGDFVKVNHNLTATQTDYITADNITNYANSMNDGITADPDGGFSYGAPWYAFYLSNDNSKYTIDPATHTGYATFDLGAAKPISEVAMQVAPAIGTASSIKAYVSDDNATWEEVATLTYEGTAIQTISAVFETEIVAQYWRFEFVTDGMFFMVSEIMVYEYKAAEKANIGSINAYDWTANLPIILAYGRDKTVETAVGGNWFAWWIKIKAEWSQDDHAFVVNAIDGAPGTESHDYETWTLGEKEVILLANSGNVDAASYAAASALAVGDKLYLYGFDFTNASVNNLSTEADGVYTSSVYFYTQMAVEDGAYDVPDVVYPGYFTDVDVPEFATVENIIDDTTVITHDYAANTSYPGDIADGIAPDSGYTTDWRSYPNGTTSTLFDLGAERSDIGGVRVYLWPANQSGIVPPDAINVYASCDNVSYALMGTFDLSDPFYSEKSSETIWAELKFEKFLNARYIKIEFVNNASFCFVGEIEICAMEEISVQYFTTTYEYSTSSINLISYAMADILDDCNANLKTHEYWNFAQVEWNAATSTYQVAGVYTAEAGKDFGDLAVPKYGFIIGAHASGGDEAAEAFAAFIASLSEGDDLYLYGADLVELTEVGTAIPDAYITTSPVAGETAYRPEVIPLYTSVGFAASDSTLFVRITKEDGTVLSTLQDVAAYIRGIEVGDQTDYNYYYVITVDADDVVTGTYYVLGRDNEGGLKGEIEIPEGGYAIGLNAGSSYAAEFQEFVVGDSVVLYGVDLDELAQNPGATIVEDDPATEDVDESSVTASTIDISGAFFARGHVHTWETIVLEPTCTADGYTYDKCSTCGEIVIDESTRVGMTGHDESGEILTKEPTCVDEGYDYRICGNCNEELVIEGTSVPATGNHTYGEGIAVNTKFLQKTCEVCSGVIYTDNDGNVAKDIVVSHRNAYNWGTYEAMIITGEGKTVTEVIGQSPLWWTVTVIQNVDGVYRAVGFYQNVAEVSTVTVPADGFLLYTFETNSAHAYANGGGLQGHYFLPIIDVEATAPFAVDPSVAAPDHIYAIEAPAADMTGYNAAKAAAEALNADDYTPETWAILEAALAVDVSNKKEYEQAAVDAATSAINAAVLGLEDAVADVVFGDIDGNGEFDGNDLVLARQVDAAMIEIDQALLDAIEVSGDGIFDGADVVLMVQMDAGFIDAWPAE